MNISLSKGSSRSKAGGKPTSIGYGLNNRNGGGDGGGGGSKNVFGGDSDDGSDDDDDGGDVNRQIAREQAAARRRAQAALQSMDDPSIYDYDGAYETFNAADKSKKEQDEKSSEPKKSRYITDLLKAAKTRERERDAIHERKVAREQAEEDAQAEYQGKEKFVTKAYKRKLEERKRWETEQEEKQREEEANDVTKKSANAAFANFYTNLNQVQRGEGADTGSKVQKTSRDGGDAAAADDDFDPRRGNAHGGGMGFLGGFERSSPGEDPSETTTNRDQNTDPAGSHKSDNDKDLTIDIESALTIRQRREKKVAEARARYFQRRRQAEAQQVH